MTESACGFTLVLNAGLGRHRWAPSTAGVLPARLLLCAAHLLVCPALDRRLVGAIAPLTAVLVSCALA